MPGNIGRKNEKKQTLLWNFFLCMDGDFNVGISSEEGLEKLIEKTEKRSSPGRIGIWHGQL